MFAAICRVVMHRPCAIPTSCIVQGRIQKLSKVKDSFQDDFGLQIVYVPWLLSPRGLSRTSLSRTGPMLVLHWVVRVSGRKIREIAALLPFRSLKAMPGDSRLSDQNLRLCTLANT